MKYSLDISNLLEEQLLETALWNLGKVMSFVYRKQRQKKTSMPWSSIGLHSVSIGLPSETLFDVKSYPSYVVQHHLCLLPSIHMQSSLMIGWFWCEMNSSQIASLAMTD